MRLIAVVVTYNRPTELNNCLKALINQSKRPDHIVIVNNGNHVELDIFSDYKTLFTVLRLQNLGSAGGQAEGIKEALNLQATDIYLLDDDGIPAHNAIEKLISARSRFGNPEDLVLTSFTYDAENGNYAPVYKAEEGVPKCPTEIFFGPEEIPKELIQNGVFMNWGQFFLGVLIPASFARKIGLPIPDFFIRGEDFEYLLRCLRNGRVGTVLDSSFQHPMPLTEDNQEPPLSGVKKYYQLRNHMIVRRQYFPRLRNHPLCRVGKYIFEAFKEKITGCRFDWIRFIAYYDAIFQNLNRDGRKVVEWANSPVKRCQFWEI
jgi:GT2 family glycosyltransferase